MDTKRDLKFKLGKEGYNISKLCGLKDYFLYSTIEYGPTSLNISNLEVDDRISNFELKNVKGEVLFPLIQGRNGKYALLSLAHAFRTRGYKPIILKCDTCLDTCFRKNNDEYDYLRCETCRYYSRELIDKFGFESTNLSDYLSEGYSTPNISSEKNIREIEYKGIRISDYAISSCRRYLRSYTIDLKSEDIRNLYTGFLHSAIRLIDAADNLFDAHEINAVLGGDAAYVYDGVIFAVAEQRSVPATTPSKSWIEGKRMFGYQKNRAPLAQYTEYDYLKKIVSAGLDKRERDEINNVMEQRANGENIRFNHSPDANKDPNIGDKYSIGLFSNLLWDASLTTDGGAYSDPFEWISTTINEVQQRKDLDLILKTHPAEHLRKTNQSIYDWVTNNYSPLPENVTLLKPDTDIDPYSLMKKLDAGIVYNSTVGLEMSYWGKPVIVAGDTHYRGLGFTHDPSTKEKYRDLLNNIEALDCDSEMRKRAQRYAYYLFVRMQIDFPYNSSPENESIYVSHEDLSTDNQIMDYIIEKILNHEPIEKP